MREIDRMDSLSETLPFSALHAELSSQPSSARRLAITAAYRCDEATAVQWLLDNLQTYPAIESTINALAHTFATRLRQQRRQAAGIDALMHEFSLASKEGIALMTMAEALLRIPDSATADRLIANCIRQGDWRMHLGQSPSLWVNIASAGLVVAAKLLSVKRHSGWASLGARWIHKASAPLIRFCIKGAVRLLGNQFIVGQTIAEALYNSRTNEQRGYRYSYDMLGESAITAEHAAGYFKAYQDAIHAIGKTANGRGIQQRPSISIKLSALHPRYCPAQRSRILQELLPRLQTLFLLAKHYNIGLTIDAEEADRLELSLDILEALVFDPQLAGFEGIGIALQAYQKRCPMAIDYLLDLAHRSGCKLMIRLVKGAYWDSEIKRAQVDGMSDFPVYTRKAYTDVSYLLCAQKLLAAIDLIYPQFATHNALTLATIYSWAEAAKVTDYEFQCLHGMGEALYDQVVGKPPYHIACRIYAPVGSHQTLLAYLVRRLLENGANSSFVSQVVDTDVAMAELIRDPIASAKAFAGQPHPDIALPVNLWGKQRQNSRGLDISNRCELQTLAAQLVACSQSLSIAAPLLLGQVSATAETVQSNPANHRDMIGKVIDANSEDVQTALACAADYASTWQAVTPTERARLLIAAADLLEAQAADFIALAIREAGKTLLNAQSEVREAVDFLRYYAQQIQLEMPAQALGVVLCISPWNFPLAIFVGQISAALAAGNVVVAKPAEQTPLIAYRAIQLLHAAGIPIAALQCLPGQGDSIGAALVADSRVDGVMFTGSLEIAQQINRHLAQRCLSEHRDIPLIAETGGINAMIVDSSALPEQVVNDVLVSAFNSAGQRCSALRVLCLQQEIADNTLGMLKGALQQQQLGNPDYLAVDIGPLIDSAAQHAVQTYLDHARTTANTLFSLDLPKACDGGTFIAPTLIEISSLSELTQEVFGPVLHVLRYSSEQLPALMDSINDRGFGLTLGIHSRIDDTIAFVIKHARVGNIYVNRNMIGAVVGAQPFGGEGKSGTGPKAGGPWYLKRLQQQLVTAEQSAVADSIKPLSAACEYIATWANKQGKHWLARLTVNYAENTLCRATQVLSGANGEFNSLTWVPRGGIFCAANTLECLLNQLAAVVATNNLAILPAQSLQILPRDLLQSLANHIVAADVGQRDTQIALIETDLVAIYRPKLATQSGAIVSVIEMQPNTDVPLWRLLVERSVCINSTAVGGNAGLMSLAP